MANESTGTTITCRIQYLSDMDPFSSTANFLQPTRPPLHTFDVNVPLINQIHSVHRTLCAPHRIDKCTLQVFMYKGPDEDSSRSYLNLYSTIAQQIADYEEFVSNRKNSIILRTQLSIRVRAMIEKLSHSTGRELRRALFSLKQIFQDDKDLVHEFVAHDGLSTLVRVGSEADQNYQNYILRGKRTRTLTLAATLALARHFANFAKFNKE